MFLKSLIKKNYKKPTANTVCISLRYYLSCDTNVSLRNIVMSADTSSGCIRNAIHTKPLAVIINRHLLSK